MPKIHTYTFHSDAGHGWLAVKRTELFDRGLLTKVTDYSYEKGGTVYLEEDMDASMFIESLKADGVPYKIVEGAYHDRSPVRSYPGFKFV
jgi:hypothetical protein